MSVTSTLRGLFHFYDHFMCISEVLIFTLYETWALYDLFSPKMIQTGVISRSIHMGYFGLYHFVIDVIIWNFFGYFFVFSNLLSLNLLLLIVYCGSLGYGIF